MSDRGRGSRAFEPLAWIRALASTGVITGLREKMEENGSAAKREERAELQQLESQVLAEEQQVDASLARSLDAIPGAQLGRSDC